MAHEYVKPRVFIQKDGMMNKFGGGSTKFKDTIEGCRVSQLVKDFGSPLFVISERSLRQKYRDAYRDFSLQYPRVQFSWSYKTNYLDAVCQLFHQEGLWAEVVSDFEYEKAIHLGVPGDKIIFNGPYKPKKALEEAVQRKSKIHVDNMEEVFLLEQIASEIKKPIEIGIRLNMDVGIHPPWTRFGFNFENQEAFSAVSKIHTSGKLKITGLHCHIGTFILEPNAYKIATQKMVFFAKKINDEFGIKIEYIDIGGGFPSSNTLHSQYLPGSQANPPISKFAEVICTELNKHAGIFETPPLLILETGRALVDDGGFLIATVIARKRLNDGTAALIIDAGINDLITTTWYKHEIVPAQAYSEFMENTIIFGPLCMNIDVVRPLLMFPALSAGDHVVIYPVGAYNMTQWWQFIRYRPAVVMIDTKGKVHEIRKRENLDYVIALESVPEHLKEKKAREKSVS